MNMRALLLSVLAVLFSGLTTEAGLNGPAAYVPPAWYNDGQLRNPYSGRPIITEEQAARNDQMMRLQERQYTAKSDEQASSIFRQMQTLSQRSSPNAVPSRPLLSVGNGAYVGPAKQFLSPAAATPNAPGVSSGQMSAILHNQTPSASAYVGPVHNSLVVPASQRPAVKMLVPGVPNGPGVMHATTNMSYGAQKQLRLLAGANDNIHRTLAGVPSSQMARSGTAKQTRSTRQKARSQGSGRTLTQAQVAAIHAKD
jgi:hypothetical protein